MHGDEKHWVDDAILTNWVSTVGANINEVEKQIAERIGVKYAVALSCGTAALHLATKLAGEKLYGQARPNQGTLQGRRVFCSDMTFDASINPVAYEDGEAVFIDTERDTWNMDPVALEKALELYPDVRLIVVAHLYGTPGKMEEIRRIADAHGALIVEDAAESLGAKYKLNGEWVETGTLGDFNCISFNGNKIITGSAGGMFLTDCKEDADKVRKWSTQSREAAPWYQHEEIGYNYRMSNIIAGIVRGQLPYLNEHAKTGTLYHTAFPMLPPKENGLVLLAHIAHHLREGLGLRQIIDWMLYVDRELDDSAWESSFRTAAEQTGLAVLAITVTEMCRMYLGLSDRITWCKNADKELCTMLMNSLLSSGNFGKKRGTGLKVESTVSRLKRRGFRYLQQAGEHNWNAYHKHRWLKPFAWIYQIGRYARQGFQAKRKGAKIIEDIGRGKKRSDLYQDLKIGEPKE